MAGECWLPFTANRAFWRRARIIKGASGHHYEGTDGRRLYDLFSGLWTSGAGHCHPHIADAIARQARQLDYSMGFQLASAPALALGERLCDLFAMDSLFFTNSGSEAVETALKIAIACQRARGGPQRRHLLGRARGYHGVNMGGLAVGGIEVNRAPFAEYLPDLAHHLPCARAHTEPFTRGQGDARPRAIAELEQKVADIGGSGIAAIIVEPVPGSGGVLPPPPGYLEHLRKLCTSHGILLIFDEVINAFGRLGHLSAGARFGVHPDIICLSKGLTNGTVPMGAVLLGAGIRDAICQGPEQLVELPHGYTCSGHPLAATAAMAALDVYEDGALFARARALEEPFADMLHGLAEHPLVMDVRNLGLMGAIDLHPAPDAPGQRGLEVHERCFWEHSLVVRSTMDCLQFAPFMDAGEDDISAALASLRQVLDQMDGARGAGHDTRQ